jgi:RHS repeat-associated protein
MVAINKILLSECTGGGCGGETGTCTDSRVHRRNAENRAPATRNHRHAQPLVNNLYQGMTLDAVTGLYDERNRNYSPTPGRWTSQDPLGYINGANTYQFVESSPVGLRKEPAMRPQEVCGRNPHRQLHVAPNGGQSRRGMGPSAEDYSRPN